MNNDIIVNGQRINRDTTGSGGFFHRDGGEGGAGQEPHPTLVPGGGGAPVPPEPTDTDPPRVAAEVTDPANAGAVQAAAQKLTDHIARVTPAIDALPNNAVIPFHNGNTMTGAELKQLWGKMNFTVTDRQFPRSRGGAVENFESKINFAVLEGYDAHGADSADVRRGLAFLLFHETAHETGIARQFARDQWLDYRARNPGLSEADLIAGYDGGDIEFRRTEQFTNSIAFGMMTSLGLALPDETEATDPSRRRTRDNFPAFGLGVE